MIIASKFVYLIASFMGSLIPLAFYFTHKKYRFDMLIIGIIMAFSSVITAYFFWTKDWWFPQTFTNTIIGIEDLILGFNTGAIAVVVNTLFFPINKIVRKRKRWSIVISTILLFMSSMFFNFYLLELSSFNSFIISSILSMFWIYYKTKISPLKSVIFAVLYTFISLNFYFFILLMNSDWIIETWDLTYLSGIIIFGFIPIEEFIFWLLFGIIFRQIYEAWLGYN